MLAKKWLRPPGSRALSSGAWRSACASPCRTACHGVAKGSDGKLRVVQILVRNTLHLLGVKRIDAQEHVGSWNTSAVREHLLADSAACSSSRTGATEKTDLELTLGTLHLLISYSESEQIN